MFLKRTYLLIGLLTAAGAADARPGSRNDDAERIPSPEIRDTEFFYGGGAPFGFLASFNDVFERMRQQMAFLLSQAPNRSALPGDGNTTSVTKVIDGHKYTVNETVYSGGNGEAGAVFKVRVVDIRPALDSAETDAPRTKEEDSIENDVNRPFQKREEDNGHGLETMDELEDFGGEIMDLSNDIYVNELAAKEDRQPDPDSEWIHDLGNDLAVNKIAHSRGWSAHPDAETLDFGNDLLEGQNPRSRYYYTTDR